MRRTPVPVTATATPAQPPQENESRLEGALLFSGRPITDYTAVQPDFQVKDRATGQACSEAYSLGAWRRLFPSYDDSTGRYALEGLEPGDYCLWVTVDAVEPFDGRSLAGDFASGSGYGTEISLVGGEAKTLDFAFDRFIHLLEPVDNGRDQPSDGASREGPYVALQGPFQLTWDPLAGAAAYSVRIATCKIEACEVGSSVFQRSVSGSTVEVDLEPSKEGEKYWLNITAMTNAGVSVGRMWGTVGGCCQGGFPFRIEAAASTIVTPSLSVSPFAWPIPDSNQTIVFNEDFDERNAGLLTGSVFATKLVVGEDAGNKYVHFIGEAEEYGQLRTGASPSALSDYLVRLRFRLPEATDQGLLIRLRETMSLTKDELDYYSLWVYHDSVQLGSDHWEGTANSYSPLQVGLLTINPGTWYPLTISMLEDRITVTLEGRTIFDIIDTRLSSGNVVIDVHGPWQVDDIQVLAVTPVGATTSSSVSSTAEPAPDLVGSVFPWLPPVPPDRLLAEGPASQVLDVQF